MYVCMYLCIYTYVCMHVYICMYVCIQIDVYICMYDVYMQCVSQSLPEEADSTNIMGHPVDQLDIPNIFGC